MSLARRAVLRALPLCRPAILNARFSSPVTLRASLPVAQRPAAFAARRWYSPQSLDEPARIVEFEEVRKHSNGEDAVIIDVREPEEYYQGHIPGAHNVPFRSSPGAFGLDASEFEDTFHFPKPSHDDTIIFYCQGGLRSSGTEQLAATYGYKNRLNYKGSMEDWKAHDGPLALGNVEPTLDQASNPTH